MCFHLDEEESFENNHLHLIKWHEMDLWAITEFFHYIVLQNNLYIYSDNENLKTLINVPQLATQHSQYSISVYQ